LRAFFFNSGGIIAQSGLSNGSGNPQTLTINALATPIVLGDGFGIEVLNTTAGGSWLIRWANIIPV
jgi:hypothetical protein